MSNDPHLDGNAGFPATRGSMLVAARSENSTERKRALEALINTYWKPVYKYIRLKWGKSVEESEDLTQEFFTELLERDLIKNYDPQKARLRTYLRMCVDGLAANQYKAAQRLKRGGGLQFLSLDFQSAEGEVQQLEIPAPGSEEDFFAREWARSVFELSLERLRQQCDACNKRTHFQLLELYDVDEGGKELTYEQVARQFGLKTSDVTNYLAYARREFRKIVLEQLQQMTATDEEYRREARSLLGVDPD
jgi:RNA polymerase sigma factor (sigma-70 family)